ncbi:MAG: chemotaxis protein CheB [Alphaproteobacteria bacterium]|nr:chemotaxis protein CheB [Alphaproteobacteria bacterium]
MNRDMIAIGGSAGSLDTLRSISSALPRDFTGNVFVVVHIGHGRSRLPELLANSGSLPVMFPADGETITPGHIYVAPTDRHLLVEPPIIRLSRGPREHFTRPAIDPLFRSVATAYGERAIGVVLSGGGSDGATGLDTIKRAGGLIVVLDPQDAIAAEMPRAAIEIADPDYVSSEAELPYLVARLVREPVSAQRPRAKDALPEALTMPERPYALTCPECGGTMRKIGNGTAAQFRCHIGHIFGAREMMPAQLELLEKALDVAQRVLNERIELSHQMAEDSRAAGRKYGLQYWERVRAEAEQQVDAIRRVLPNGAEAEEEPLDASE